MAPVPIEIRGAGFITTELVDRLASRADVNRPLVRAFADTLHFTNRLLSQLTVSKQETPEEKQKVISLLVLVRLVEISESIFILAAHGVRQDLHSLFRIFLDAYFLIANVCSDAGFVPVYFRTDVPSRLKLMRAASKRDDALFKELNDYATAELQNELDQKIQQERIQAHNSFVFAERAGCGNLYDSMYRLCSASIHSSPRCLEEYVEVDEEGRIRTLIHAGDNETIHRVLYDTQYFLLKALRGVCEIFTFVDDGSLLRLDQARESAMENVEP